MQLLYDSGQPVRMQVSGNLAHDAARSATSICAVLNSRIRMDILEGRRWWDSLKNIPKLEINEDSRVWNPRLVRLWESLILLDDIDRQQRQDPARAGTINYQRNTGWRGEDRTLYSVRLFGGAKNSVRCTGTGSAQQTFDKYAPIYRTQIGDQVFSFERLKDTLPLSSNMLAYEEVFQDYPVGLTSPLAEIVLEDRTILIRKIKTV